MRYLLLSDIHSNLEALKTVLERARMLRYDRLIVVGDIVGYYAEPNECIELLKMQNDAIILQGNHDAAVAEEIDTKKFNETARKAIEWTKKEISEKNKEFLKSLPKFFSIPFLLAVHGTPFNALWGYMNEVSAKETIEKVPENVVVCGHNHVCFQYTESKGLVEYARCTTVSLEENCVISLPSVGQPRDENQQTGLALIDFEKKEMRIERINYNIEKTISKTEKVGLPKELIERLRVGK